MALPDPTQHRHAFTRFIDAVMKPIAESFTCFPPDDDVFDVEFPEFPPVPCEQCRLAAHMFWHHWVQSLARLL